MNDPETRKLLPSESEINAVIERLRAGIVKAREENYDRFAMIMWNSKTGVYEMGWQEPSTLKLLAALEALRLNIADKRYTAESIENALSDSE